jgi:hypothetical protein
MGTSEGVMFARLLTILSCGIAPSMLVWGWARWGKRPKLRTVPSILSLVGFILATASAALAASSLAYAYFHQFPDYDPVHYRMFGCGVWISFAAILLGLSGAWAAKFAEMARTVLCTWDSRILDESQGVLSHRELTFAVNGENS